MEAKATLEFNLPEQEYDFKYACAGLDALLTLNDIDQELRSAVRYNTGEFTHYIDDETKERKECCVETLHHVRKVINEMVHERKLPELI